MGVCKYSPRSRDHSAYYCTWAMENVDSLSMQMETTSGRLLDDGIIRLIRTERSRTLHETLLAANSRPLLCYPYLFFSCGTGASITQLSLSGLIYTRSFHGGTLLEVPCIDTARPRTLPIRSGREKPSAKHLTPLRTTRVRRTPADSKRLSPR